MQLERRHFDIKDCSGTLGLIRVLGRAVVVFFTTFFLLESGDSFRRKLVKLAGPAFGKMKVTIPMLDEITVQIQRFAMVQAFTSVLVGWPRGRPCCGCGSDWSGQRCGAPLRPC